MPGKSETNPPRFVLSYSRRDNDEFLDRFFTDLRKEIAVREGLDPRKENAEPGYRDVDAIPGGSDWTQELAAALARGWACVSLYTPNYFKRPACGKEFQVFLDRAKVEYADDGAAKGAKGILPVLWASRDDLARHGMPPGVVSRINFRARKHHQRYEQEGLRWILRRSPRAAYLDILQDIVGDLIAGFGDKPDALPAPPEFEKVKNAFDDPGRKAEPRKPLAGGPDSLAVYMVVAAGKDGLFSLEGAETWISALEEQDPHLDIDAKSVDPDVVEPADLIALLENSTKSNAVVLLVVDPVTVKDRQAKVIDFLADVVAAGDWAGAIMAPGADTDAAAHKILEKVTIPEARVEQISLVSASDREEPFLAQVRARLRAERKRVVADGIVQRRAPGGGKPAEKPRIHGPAKAPDRG